MDKYFFIEPADDDLQDARALITANNTSEHAERNALLSELVVSRMNALGDPDDVIRYLLRTLLATVKYASELVEIVSDVQGTDASDIIALLGSVEPD
jgi:hypothetical protein